MDNLVMDKARLDIFSGKRIFVTGHTGFKGIWLYRWLSDLGAEVYGYSHPTQGYERLYLATREVGIHYETFGDIRDKELLLRTMQDFQPDAVMHLAAQPIVREGYKNPLETLSSNVMGTATVLECIRECPSVRAITVVTSDKCYENKEQDRGYGEDDQLGGSDPYSASKACCEIVAKAYRDSFFANGDMAGRALLSTVRAGNVLGGGDYGKDRILPDIIRSFQSGEQLILRNPGAVRPWQSVLDPLAGYIMLTGKLLEGKSDYQGPWNFGPSRNENWTVEMIVDQCFSLLGGGTYAVQPDSEMPEHTMLVLNSDKAYTNLGWRQNLSVTETLEQAIEVYKLLIDERKGEEVVSAMLSQIRNHKDR